MTLIISKKYNNEQRSPWVNAICLVPDCLAGDNMCLPEARVYFPAELLNKPVAAEHNILVAVLQASQLHGDVDNNALPVC